MLIPTKHENLNFNLLIIGADILRYLSKRGRDLEALFQLLKSQKQLSLDQYYNAILFLWMAELIEMEEYILYIKRNNVPDEDIF